MKPLSKGISFVALALLLVAGSASAISVVGDPVDSDSWYQPFVETTGRDAGTGGSGGWMAWTVPNHPGGLFTLMQVHMNTTFPDLFLAPVFTAISSTGWTTTPLTGTPGTAYASGLATNYATFNINFAPNRPEAFSMSFQAYNGSNLVDDGECVWNGSSWSFPTGQSLWYQAGQNTAVPEPISMMMLGCLGAGMFAARKLRGKRAT